MEIFAKLYTKNPVTTSKSMTNARWENSILRFQPFALRLQIQVKNESWQEGNKKNYPQNVGQEPATKPHEPSYATCWKRLTIALVGLSF